MLGLLQSTCSSLSSTPRLPTMLALILSANRATSVPNATEMQTETVGGIPFHTGQCSNTRLERPQQLPHAADLDEVDLPQTSDDGRPWQFAPTRGAALQDCAQRSSSELSGKTSLAAAGSISRACLQHGCFGRRDAKTRLKHELASDHRKQKCSELREIARLHDLAIHL